MRLSFAVIIDEHFVQLQWRHGFFNGRYALTVLTALAILK